MSSALGFDDSRTLRFFTIQLVFLILAWLFSILRAWVKVFMIKKITIDDWLMLLALAMYTVYSVISLDGTRNGGTGRETSELTLAGAALALRAWYLCEVLYAPLSAAIRCSIALFLLRLAVVRAHRIIVYVNLGVITVISIGYFFILLLQCSPPSYFWNQIYGVPGHCVDPRIVPDASIVYSAIGAISDASLALLPIWMLWNVKLNLRTKISIAVLLSMGMLAAAALIVRIPLIKFLAVSENFLYETVGVAEWTVLEPSLGIIAGCIATLKPLFKSLGFGTSSTRGYGSKPPKASNPSTGPTWPGSSLSRSRGTTHKMLSESGTETVDGIEFEVASPRSIELRDKVGSGVSATTADRGSGGWSSRVTEPGGVITRMGHGSSPPPMGGWDVEAAAGSGGAGGYGAGGYGVAYGGPGGHGWQPSRPVVHVQTSIDVTTQQRRASQSSSEPILPLQGERVVVPPPRPERRQSVGRGSSRSYRQE